MYCAYAQTGPLLFKAPTGLVVAAFSTLDLFHHFLAQKPTPTPVEPVEVSKLRSPEYPMPEQWSIVTEALLFDTVEAIERFLADANTFPYRQHIVPLRSHGV
jgi:hypothetical protein